MTELTEYVDGLPNICGSEAAIESALRESAGNLRYPDAKPVDLGRIRSGAAVALHMHQPLIPAGGNDLHTAEIISNLQYMMEHQDIGDNHNAPVFVQCYRRMGEFIPQLIHEGKEPRVMLEYSGTLLHGLRQMGQDGVFEDLKKITCDPQYNYAVEWLGAPWGHAVAPS
ncbi:MAG: glycosyl hydrolase family 57, partial [Gammaproteobacteria bacterium]